MQIPLALQWALVPGIIILPLLGDNYVAWAWVLAAFGALNSAIIFSRLDSHQERASGTEGAQESSPEGQAPDTDPAGASTAKPAAEEFGKALR